MSRRNIHFAVTGVTGVTILAIGAATVCFSACPSSKMDREGASAMPVSRLAVLPLLALSLSLAGCQKPTPPVAPVATPEPVVYTPQTQPQAPVAQTVPPPQISVPPTQNPVGVAQDETTQVDSYLAQVAQFEQNRTQVFRNYQQQQSANSPDSTVRDQQAFLEQYSQLASSFQSIQPPPACIQFATAYLTAFQQEIRDMRFVADGAAKAQQELTASGGQKTPEIQQYLDTLKAMRDQPSAFKNAQSELQALRSRFPNLATPVFSIGN